jgi:hypothetical protein
MMMKLTFRRIFPLAVILVALAPPGAEAGLLDRFGIGLNVGTLLSQKGNYNISATLRRTVLPGAGYGLSLRYRISNSLFIDGGFSYNWMYFRKETRPAKWVSYKPAFVAPLYSLNLTYYLPHVRGISPFITAGGGVCPWWFSSAVWGGELWMAPADRHEQFTKVSRQVNAGLGLEVMLGSKLSVQGEARYYRVFVGNVAKFGAFGDQDLLGVRLGVTFYFGGRESKKMDMDNTP